jgi:uncharacterized membrane protein YfcA
MQDPVEEERRRRPRRALLLAAAGVLCLLAGLGLGSLARSDGLARILPVLAGFLGLVVLTRRALLLLRVDSFLFEKPSERPRGLDRLQPSVRSRRTGAVKRRFTA